MPWQSRASFPSLQDNIHHFQSRALNFCLKIRTSGSCPRPWPKPTNLCHFYTIYWTSRRTLPLATVFRWPLSALKSSVGSAMQEMGFIRKKKKKRNGLGVMALSRVPKRWSSLLIPVSHLSSLWEMCSLCYWKCVLSQKTKQNKNS